MTLTCQCHSRSSLKIKFNAAVGLPVYDFKVVFTITFGIIHRFNEILTYKTSPIGGNGKILRLQTNSHFQI